MHNYPQVERSLLSFLSSRKYKEEIAIAVELEVSVQVIKFVLKDMQKRNLVRDRYFPDWEARLTWREWRLNQLSVPSSTQGNGCKRDRDKQ